MTNQAAARTVAWRGDAVLRRRLQQLMAGRLFVATVLLGASIYFTADAAHGYRSFTPRALIGLIVATFAVSLASGVWVYSGRRLRLAAIGQLLTDVLLTSALVSLTGGAGSVFTILYGATVLMAALAVGPGVSVSVATLAILSFTGLGISFANGWIPHPPDQLPQQYLLSTAALGASLLSNIFGLAIVTSLATALSLRLSRTGGLLIAAERSALMLERLNDRIVRSITSGLLTTDLDMRIETINPAGTEIYRSDAATLLGRDANEFLPIDQLDLSSTGGQRGEGEASRPDGSSFPVGFTVNPLVGEGGAVRGTLITFQDLTEIHELRVTAERAERLAVLGRLSTGLAHEIRNPLGSISGSVELVRDAPELGEEDRRLLSIVISEVDRLNGLVSTMLDVGRPQSPNRTATNLCDLVRDVVAVAGSASTAAGLQIDAQVPDEAVLAEVDPDQLRQVVWNLLKNAIQASPDGAPITVGVEAISTDVARIEIRDQGSGIDEGRSDELFDMFYSGRSHGVGLGLALVRQIVERHGGRITAENHPEGGAIFRVVLPRRAPDSPPERGSQ